MKKNFPKWFSAYCKPMCPHKPSKPTKKLKVQRKTLIKNNLWDGRIISIQDFKESNCEELKVEIINDSHDGIYVNLYNVYYEEVKNEKYEAELGYYRKYLEEYKKQKKIYNERKEQWTELKKEYDKEINKKREKKEKAQYEKLKKKFEGK